MRFLPGSLRSEARLLLLSRGVRAFGDGVVSLVLPAYLSALGFDAFAIGVLVTATLAGSSILTLPVGFFAHRFNGRALLLAASALMAVTGMAFAFVDGFWPLLL